MVDLEFNTSEIFKIEKDMTIEATSSELDQPKLTKLGNVAEIAAAHWACVF